MKAARLVIDWSFALRANTVPDQCALRFLPYPNNLLLAIKMQVHAARAGQNKVLRRQFLASHPQNPFA